MAALPTSVDDAGQQGEDPRARGGAGAVTDLAGDHPVPQRPLRVVVGQGEFGMVQDWKIASQSLSNSTARAWVLA